MTGGAMIDLDDIPSDEENVPGPFEIPVQSPVKSHKKKKCKLLTDAEREAFVKLLKETNQPNKIIDEFRLASIEAREVNGLGPFSMEQIAEAILAWEEETLPSIDTLGQWVYPGKKARVPNRRVQMNFQGEKDRTTLVTESQFLNLRCHCHPDDIVETFATGHVPLPPLSEEMTLYLPKEIISKALLSSTQVETVSYAARRFNGTLPDGNTQGYCLGDGTGCGKGRVIAALIIHLWNQGFRRHLWVSVSKDLINDSRRDLKDLQAGDIPVFDISTEKNTSPKDGVAFVTYALLGRRFGRGKEMDIIYDHMGREGGGLLCFDEAHKAKNLHIQGESQHTNGPDRKNKSTKVAQAVLGLQKVLPKAKVLYSSATCATEIRHMGYMNRLGLWGPKKSFVNFKQFENYISGGGVTAMEMLAVNMKSMGMMSCRSLAYTNVDFEVLQTKITPEQKRMYDGAVDIFQRMKSMLVQCLNPKNPISANYTRQKKGLFWMSYFWSVQQRFFKQLLVAFKVDDAVRLTLDALAKDYQVVLSMWGTGAARMEDAMKAKGKEKEKNGLDPALHDDLLSGPALTLEHGIKGLILGINSAMKKEQQTLLDKVAKLKLPANSIDDLIDKLGGHDKVAEMSGRSNRLVWNKSSKGYKFESRSAQKDPMSSDTVNLTEQKMFQNGSKRVAIITEAASTGISLHSDKRTMNKRRRLMITLELPWGADKAIQQFGRVHRSNQHCAPRFQIVLTPVSGEVRFASTIARRLKFLGAVTKGDRNEGVGGNLGDRLQEFDVHNSYGKHSLSQLFEDLRCGCDPNQQQMYEQTIAPHVQMDFESFTACARSMLEFVDLNDTKDKKVFQKADELVESGTINQFLNRILMFPLEIQNAVFDCFMAVYDFRVQKDIDAGIFAEGQVSLNQSLLNITLLDRERIHRDSSGAVTDLLKLQLDRGVNWEIAHEIYSHLDRSKDSVLGFYHFWAHNSKNREVVLARKSQRTLMYELVTPHNGVKTTASGNPISAPLLRGNAFRPLGDIDVAKKEWEAQRLKAVDMCIHRQRGFMCSKGAECKEGKRQSNVTLLAGAFLEVWGTIAEHVNMVGKGRNTKSGSDKQNLPLVRVMIEGRAFVGVRLLPQAVKEVTYILRNMGTETEQEDSETCMAIIEMFKSMPTAPFTSWIDAHKELTTTNKISAGNSGLQSVKIVWNGLKDLSIIQELVMPEGESACICKTSKAEEFHQKRWGNSFTSAATAIPKRENPNLLQPPPKKFIEAFDLTSVPSASDDDPVRMASSDCEEIDEVVALSDDDEGPSSSTKMSSWDVLAKLAKPIEAKQEESPYVGDGEGAMSEIIDSSSSDESSDVVVCISDDEVETVRAPEAKQENNVFEDGQFFKHMEIDKLEEGFGHLVNGFSGMQSVPGAGTSSQDRENENGSLSQATTVKGNNMSPANRSVSPNEEVDDDVFIIDDAPSVNDRELNPPTVKENVDNLPQDSSSALGMDEVMPDASIKRELAQDADGAPPPESLRKKRREEAQEVDDQLAQQLEELERQGQGCLAQEEELKERESRVKEEKSDKGVVINGWVKRNPGGLRSGLSHTTAQKIGLQLDGFAPSSSSSAQVPYGEGSRSSGSTLDSPGLPRTSLPLSQDGISSNISGTCDGQDGGNPSPTRSNQLNEFGERLLGRAQMLHSAKRDYVDLCSSDEEENGSSTKPLAPLGSDLSIDKRPSVGDEELNTTLPVNDTSDVRVESTLLSNDFTEADLTARKTDDRHPSTPSDSAQVAGSMNEKSPESTPSLELPHSDAPATSSGDPSVTSSKTFSDEPPSLESVNRKSPTVAFSLELPPCVSPRSRITPSKGDPKKSKTSREACSLPSIGSSPRNETKNGSTNVDNHDAVSHPTDLSTSVSNSSPEPTFEVEKSKNGGTEALHLASPQCSAPSPQQAHWKSSIFEKMSVDNHHKNLRSSLQRKDLACFTTLLGHKNTDMARLEGGRTLLHEAIKVGNAEAVEVLLENEKIKELLLEVRDSTGATPLIAALRLPRPLKIVELLTKHSANLEATDSRGRTAPELASEFAATHPESSLLCKLLGFI